MVEKIIRHESELIKFNYDLFFSFSIFKRNFIFYKQSEAIEKPILNKREKIFHFTERNVKSKAAGEKKKGGF